MNLEQAFALAHDAYEKKIHHFAAIHYFELPGFTFEDLKQEMMVALWKTVETYDPNKGAKFNTLFWQCARNRYKDLIKRAQTEGRKTEWFDLPDPDLCDYTTQARVEASAEDWAIALMSLREDENLQTLLAAS